MGRGWSATPRRPPAKCAPARPICDIIEPGDLSCFGCRMRWSICPRAREDKAAGAATVARQVVRRASQSGEVHHNLSCLCDGLGLGI
jgi:hypothetical protein